eukprot:COSAG02_NODE_4417_length_5382_cov_32.075147_1_plen_582_part_10
MRQQGRFVRRAFCTFCCAASLLLHGGGATPLQPPPLADVDAPAEAFFSAEARGLDPANLLSNESLALGRDTTELAVALASAALRALAADPHRQSGAAELARRLLELDDRGHLAEAFARPAVSAALARELRGVRCTNSELISTSRTAESPQRRWQQPRDRAAGDGSVGGDAAGPDGRSSPPDRSVQQAPARGPSVWGTSGSPHFKLVAHRSAAATVNRTHRLPAAPESPPTQLQTTAHAAAQSGVQDGAALLQGFVRDPKGGAGWAALRGWVSGSDPCGSSMDGLEAWEGISCDTDGRVTEVDLEDYSNLRFELLGRELSRLDCLSGFRVAGTAMSGSIPSELGELTDLQRLALYSNPSLSGTIPSVLGQLTNLQLLYLFSNPSLTGTIPSELGELTNLQDLSLYSNPSLSGTIPGELGELTDLQLLYVHNNSLVSGTIPSELGELTNLQQLYVHNNSLVSGTIPSELGELTNLQQLALYSNPSLTGTIPSVLGQLTNLQVLYLDRNPSLTGTIPSELGELTNLQYLKLYSNPSLSGTIPSELRDLTDLQALYLNNNPSLTGTIPGELGELTNLQYLELDTNP